MPAKARYANCDNCPLKARPFVPTKHVKDAILLIVGETPDTPDIIDGVPFSGEAGIVLNQALEYAHIPAARVAKTNAVLCRPIGNQDAPLEAIRACSVRLAHDIKRAGVQRVLTTGGTAIAALDGINDRQDPRGILARAGETYKAAYDPYTYTATVNPAYLFKTDSYTPNVLRHMQRAVSPNTNDFKIEYVSYAVMTPDNKRAIISYINNFEDGARMAFDVETDDLQWYDTPDRPAAPLLCLVITLERWKSIIIPADLYDYADVRECVEDALDRYEVVTANGKFDQNVMAARVATHFKITDDTMLAHFALYELARHGLKELASDYLNAPKYEETLIDEWFKAHGIVPKNRKYSLLPKERLYYYAAIDGVVTYQLIELFKADLIRKGLYEYPYQNVLIRIANALTQVERTGIPIDREQLISASDEFGKELAALEIQMEEMIAPLIGTDADKSAGELARLMKSKRKGEAPRFNPSSPPQVHHILYNVLGLKLNKRLIKPTNTNTGKEALEALPDHEFVRLLRHYRRIEKMHDTYLASIARRANVNDEINVDFRITGTEIGRLSASNGDHGIPRADDYYGAVIRSVFATHEDSDEVFIIADYSQAELRAFAHLARVQFLINKYNAGEDVHTETAIMLEKAGAPIFAGFAEALFLSKHGATEAIRKYNATKVKRLRVLAKNINFGNIYQGGAQGISGMIGGAIPAPVIQQVINVYHTIMPEAREYAIKQYEFLKTHGYVKTVFNRYRRFYVINQFNQDEAHKAVVHMVVAGSAADCTNLAVAELVELGVRVCHSVHDSIIARAKRSEAPEVAALMTHVMTHIGSSAMGSVPWIVDIDREENGDFPTRWVAKPTRAAYQLT